MGWQNRVLLSVITAGLGIFLAALGGFLGPKAHVMVWFALTAVLAALLLPWDAVVFSQEDMLQEMKDLDAAIEELAELRPKLQELHAELDACAGLNQEELLAMAARFEEVRSVSDKSQLSLREVLFGNYRRALVVQLIAIAIAGLGGALMAYKMALLF